MYIVKKTGYIVSSYFSGRILSKTVKVTYESKQWKIWRTNITPGTCYYCASMNGRIFAVDDPAATEIPVHPNCRCYTEMLTAIVAGTATNAGKNGVDLYVALHGVLPDSYISEAEEQGWKKWLGNLAEVLPGRMVGGKVYRNRDHRLPESDGRIWHEADFDYINGHRNTCRLLYSNDSLLFVTYDHYLTFFEIGLEDIE